MSKLLRIDLTRLFKNKVFWCELAFFLVYPIFSVLNLYRDSVAYDYIVIAEEVIWSAGEMAAIAMAVLVPLFIGTDYSDKTIRNKLIAGYGKSKVFLSNAVTMLIANTIMLTVWNIAYCTTAAFLLPFGNPLKLDVLYCAEVYCANFVMTVLFVTVSMFISAKAGATVACILGCLGFMLIGVMIMTRLDAQEMIPEYIIASNADIDVTVNTEDNNWEQNMQMVPNPQYIPEGPYKDFLRGVVRVSATAQLTAVTSAHDVEPVWYFVFDNIVVAIIVAGGSILFRKKEIS